MINSPHRIDFTAKHHPFAYQLNAVEEVKNLDYAGLFHEQGLGKTKIALDLALFWLENKIVDSTLIITKKGLINNWKNEIEAHTHVPYAELDGRKSTMSRVLNRPYRIYLTHYESIVKNKNILSLFLKTRRVGTVLDEAHYMKNPDGKIANTLFSMSTGFSKRVIMTGTPIANRPYDIWSQIYFLDQGKALGSNFKQFKSEYDLPKGINLDVDDDDIPSNYREALKAIHHKIGSFTVRETKRTAKITLPNKTLLNYVVEMKDVQLEMYQRFKREIRVSIARDGNITPDNIENVLKRMLRLIQVASNPILVDESYEQTPCKYFEVEKILKRLSNSQKVIVWTNFIQNADWLADILSPHGTTKIHGKLDMLARNRAIDKFKQDPSCKVLIATPGAAKEGLTLTVANLAIFYDRNFSLNDWLQAQDRIHRISQEHECEVIHLLAENTIDEWIDALLKFKNTCAMYAQGDAISSQRHTTEINQFIKGVLA